MKRLHLIAAILSTMAITKPVLAQDGKPLIFESSPALKMDESGNFETCGYDLRARVDGDNWSTGLQVFVFKNKENVFFVQTRLSKRESATAAWQPRYNLIKWVRLGDAKPIELDPSALIAYPDEGASSSSVKMSGNFNPFPEMEKPTTNIWVQVFDRVSQERVTYYGVVKNDAATNGLVKQCLKGISGANKKS